MLGYSVYHCLRMHYHMTQDAKQVTKEQYSCVNSGCFGNNVAYHQVL